MDNHQLILLLLKSIKSFNMFISTYILLLFKETALSRLRNDLASFKKKICEKRTKPFAWLGNLVATRMDEIIPEQQDDAAWEVQCLMRRLVLKSKNASSSQSVSCDLLQNAMSGVFDETDFE